MGHNKLVSSASAIVGLGSIYTFECFRMSGRVQRFCIASCANVEMEVLNMVQAQEGKRESIECYFVRLNVKGERYVQTNSATWTADMQFLSTKQHTK